MPKNTYPVLTASVLGNNNLPMVVLFHNYASSICCKVEETQTPNNSQRTAPMPSREGMGDHPSDHCGFYLKNTGFMNDNLLNDVPGNFTAVASTPCSLWIQTLDNVPIVGSRYV